MGCLEITWVGKVIEIQDIEDFNTKL